MESNALKPTRFHSAIALRLPSFVLSKNRAGELGGEASKSPEEASPRQNEISNRTGVKNKF